MHHQGYPAAFQPPSTTFGYTPLYIARGLKLPPSRVYGVATFYHFFTLSPKGEHTCTVCSGTACYVKGADALVAAISQQTDAQLGKTTPDGEVSLETARCLGTCGQAPVVGFDGGVVGNLSPEMVTDRVKGWIGHGSE